MSRILTCEQVSDGHPDKICDQVADAIVTDCLVHDKESRVAIECLLKDSRLIIAGELTSKHQPDYRRRWMMCWSVSEGERRNTAG